MVSLNFSNDRRFYKGKSNYLWLYFNQIQNVRHTVNLGNLTFAQAVNCLKTFALLTKILLFVKFIVCESNETKKSI